MVSTFDEAEIRRAERALEKALESPDRTAWVYHYTEDAMFVAPGEVVQGREALLEMARGMNPLSSVSIEPQRTEGNANLAYTYGEGHWTSGNPDTGARTNVRLIIVWRKEADGAWRVAHEMLDVAGR